MSLKAEEMLSNEVKLVEDYGRERFIVKINKKNPRNGPLDKTNKENQQSAHIQKTSIMT